MPGEYISGIISGGVRLGEPGGGITHEDIEGVVMGLKPHFAATR
jgi:hypothetical protein